MTRGPISEQRLSIDGDGLVVLELKCAFSDGTTHELFEPEDFIAPLAALVLRPRSHLVRYRGLFAPNAQRASTHRARVTAAKAEPTRVSALTILLSVPLSAAIGRLWPRPCQKSERGEIALRKCPQTHYIAVHRSLSPRLSIELLVKRFLERLLKPPVKR